MTHYKHQPAIERRIENLGQLAERRKVAMQANDLDELERIALAYLSCNQPLTNTAHEIRLYVSVERKKVNNA